MTKYSEGQEVVISEYRYSGEQLRDGKVTKVGRKWVTVQSDRSEYRFDMDGKSDQDWGHPPRLWPSRDAYDAEKLRRKTWDELHSYVRQHSHAPKHLTTEQIAELLAKLKPEVE